MIELRRASEIPGVSAKEFQQAKENMRAFRGAYAEMVEQGKIRMPEPSIDVPVEAMLAAAKAEAVDPESRARFRQNLKTFIGLTINEAQLDEVYGKAFDRWRAVLGDLAGFDFRQPHLHLHNLESDGLVFLGERRFIWAAPRGDVYAASVDNEDEWDIAGMVMVASIVVEAIGVIAAIAGVALPTGKNLDRLGIKIWGRLKPDQRAKFIRFMAQLLDPKKGIEQKIGTIFKFLKWLNGLGLIHLAINDVLEGWDGLDIALTIAQILLTLASLLIPGGAAISVGARLVAISNALVSVIRKGKALKANLESS